MQDTKTPIEVKLYKSSLCPRCMMAGKVLNSLQADFPNMSFTVIDIASQPLQSWRDGVRMIPAIKIQGVILSGLILGEESIRNFLEKYARPSLPPTLSGKN